MTFNHIDKVNVGDELDAMRWCNGNFVVKEIIDERPARGDWSDDKWEGIVPTFYAVIVSARFAPVTTDDLPHLNDKKRR